MWRDGRRRLCRCDLVWSPGVVGADGRPVRNAAGATIRRGGLEFDVYSVHLKSGCHQDPISEPRNEACRVLSRQRSPVIP